MVPFLVSKTHLGRWRASIPRQGQTLTKGWWQENTAGPHRMSVGNERPGWGWKTGWRQKNTRVFLVGIQLCGVGGCSDER